MMEIGNQIKKYRNGLELSQDVLAEHIFVSRQTISNWETNKSYPDVKSLLLLSSFFSVSLDILIRGDLEEMKEKIKKVDIDVYQHEGRIFEILTIALLLSPVPLIHFLGDIGVGLVVLLFIVTMYWACRIEKLKKKFDIQTYKEVVAFSEGRQLNEVDKHREFGKRPYQKILLAIGAGLLMLIVAIIMDFIINIF